MTSPTARTLDYLREHGWNVVVLEHFNIHARRRIDKWGADVLAQKDRVLMAIQATSDTNHSSRVEKSKANPDVFNWLRGGVRFYVYSWGKKGARGQPKNWELRVTRLVEGDDFEIVEFPYGGERTDTRH